MLVVELWGLGDVALAIPFIRAAAAKGRVSVLAKPHAGPVLQHFAPGVEHIVFTAPWTAFTRKYRLHEWPWREFLRLRGQLAALAFDIGVSARHDPRDHALLAWAGVRHRIGFPRTGSSVLLTEALKRPARRHRADHWRALAEKLKLGALPTGPVAPRPGRRVVIHTGAGHAVRMWPRERFEQLAARLREARWDVVVIDDSSRDIPTLLQTLDRADRFIGNDSGPGHLAALLGVPTFTLFGPQLPELFAPQHPQAAWITGAPCAYKPCFDSCRYAQPHCLTSLSIEQVWPEIERWLT